MTGVPAGTEIQARVVEVGIDDPSSVDAGPVQEYVSFGDTADLLYGVAADTVQ